MKNLQKIVALIFILSALFFFITLPKYIEHTPIEIKKEVPDLIDKVEQTIELSPKIPGLSIEESRLWRAKILKAWKKLAEKGSFELIGKDKEMRPYFVAIQGAVENSLAHQLQKEIIALKGFIITPLPAGALCSNGEISKELIDPSIELDPPSLFSIKARTTIVRDYLFKGGELYVIYPKKGFRERSLEQQKIYTNELIIHSDFLFDVPLNCETVPHDLVGAIYLFQTQDGQLFVFAIKMMQEKNAKENDNFILWFGPIDTPSIQKRLRDVNSFLEKNGCDVLKKGLEEFAIRS